MEPRPREGEMHPASEGWVGQDWDEDALIRQYAFLIDRCARRLVVKTGMRFQREELWGAGGMALLEAARRFRPEHGVPFVAYARHRIHGAMVDEIRRQDRLPRRLRARTERVAAARSAWVHRHGTEPSTEDVAEVLGISAEELALLDHAAQPMAGLDHVMPLASEADSPEDHVERREQRELLCQAWSTLPARLQHLLALCFGAGMTYREIGSVLDVSEGLPAPSAGVGVPPAGHGLGCFVTGHQAGVEPQVWRAKRLKGAPQDHSPFFGRGVGSGDFRCWIKPHRAM